jgi:hypothetical protein
LFGPQSPAETITEPPPHLTNAFVLGLAQGIVDDLSAERTAGRGDHGQREGDRPFSIDASASQGLTISFGAKWCTNALDAVTRRPQEAYNHSEKCCSEALPSHDQATDQR